MSDRTPYLYKRTDYGSTWQRITDEIRENDYSWVIREDTVRPGLLYAGTETGAYVSFDDGDSWQSLQRNLEVQRNRLNQIIEEAVGPLLSHDGGIDNSRALQAQA